MLLDCAWVMWPKKGGLSRWNKVLYVAGLVLDECELVQYWRPQNPKGNHLSQDITLWYFLSRLAEKLPKGWPHALWHAMPCGRNNTS